MTLEQQCVSLEIAKRLKELGVEQQSILWWQEEPEPHLVIDATQSYVDFCVAAFTTSELGGMLPITAFSTKVRGQEWLWRCENVNANGYISASGANTEADARGKMLIYLLENKLITL